jgi:hypothetical protein
MIEMIMMKKFFGLGLILFLVLIAVPSMAQKMTVAQMKAGMEKAANPIAYVREVLKKKYRIDTVAIYNTMHYASVADSLAYNGKQGKVYGPIEKKYLVQIIGKAPNTFTRISQIFIDTSMFTRRIADSLATSIKNRIDTGAVSFEDMAVAYSMGGEATTKGDLGWVARGTLIPEIEKQVALHKKGEVFKLWTKAGVHILKKTGDPKQDTGFVLMLRVIL